MGSESGGVWELPSTATEHATRLAGVRAEMARRRLDLLYVSSPANLNRLLGHRAVSFDPRNVTGLAVPAADVPPVHFDTYDHAPGWPPTITDAVKCGERGFSCPERLQTVVDTLRARGLLKGRVVLEHWSWAPGGPAFAELAGPRRSGGHRHDDRHRRGHRDPGAVPGHTDRRPRRDAADVDGPRAPARHAR